MGFSKKEKPVTWIGSSHDDWIGFPDDVQDVMGYALHLAQHGEKADYVKPLKGFKGAGTLEIVDDFDGDTYRAIYTVRFKDVVYVLHAFHEEEQTGNCHTKTGNQSDRKKVKERRGAL